MKKVIMSALLAASAFVATPSMAAVDLNTYRFECPNASGGSPSERLTNYGSYIRGMGESNIGQNKILAIYRGVPSVAVPLDLSTGNYVHAGAQYNPSSGRITCQFTSPTAAPFNVSYQASNILNGWVVKASDSNITIRVLAGFSAQK